MRKQKIIYNPELDSDLAPNSIRGSIKTGFRIKSGMTVFFVLCGMILVYVVRAATADHLVISQVQITGGPGKTTNDFVEIYNPTNSDIDLKGIRLVKRTKTGTTDTSIKSWTDSQVVKPHGYFLWANSDFTDIVVMPDATTTATLANDNSVALRSGSANTGTIIDSLGWGEAENVFVESVVFATNPDAGQSLERKPGGGSGNGEDMNNNVSDFFLQNNSHPRNSSTPSSPASPAGGSPPSHGGENPAPPPQPPLPPVPVPPSLSPSPSASGGGGNGGSSPAPRPEASGVGVPTDNVGATLSPPPPFNLEFSEILPNPGGADEGKEWVELYNPDTVSFSLAGWYLDDEGDEPKLGSGALLLGSDAIVTASSFYVIKIPKGKISLNNTSGDTVRLFDPGKNLKLEKAYSGPAPDGQSYAKNSQGKWEWTAALTPGSTNKFLSEKKETAKKSIETKVIKPEQKVEETKQELADKFPESTTTSQAPEVAGVSTGKRSYFWLILAIFPAAGLVGIGIFLKNKAKKLRDNQENPIIKPKV